jgi:NADPH:quinone reductase-like Zn-dependent oxidoreductase
MNSSDTMASAIWYQAPGAVVIRQAPLGPLPPGSALVRTLASGISRGTERLVLAGQVPASEWARMRAPMQQGDFPFPVEYGYCAVGLVEEGPKELLNRMVFCLHPHQDRFIAPIAMLTPIPAGIPANRATLAANMETALNAIWDSGAGPADQILVVGGGVVGLLLAWLAAGLPGAAVTLCDIDASRAVLAQRLGVNFVLPEAAPKGCDVVFHTSASAAGLDTAIASAGMEACVVELSWYGDRAVPLLLGGAFHSQRLRLIASQVGQVAPSRRPRWSYARRLAAAISLLHDRGLDALVGETMAFADAPQRLPQVLADGALGLPPVIRYPEPV